MSESVLAKTWAMMENGAFYTPRDVANSIGIADEEAAAVLSFLADYEFAKSFHAGELFTKNPQALDPIKAFIALRALVPRGK